MNWVDLVILGILTLFALEAIGRPLVIEVLDLVSFLLAFFLSFTFYNFPAKFFEANFQIPHGLSLVLSFMVIWFISETLFYTSLRFLLTKLPPLKSQSLKVLSAIPALFRGVIFVALFLVMIATFPIQPMIKKAVLDSRLGSFILNKAYLLERPVKNVFGGVTSDSLTFLTIKPQTNEKINLGFQTAQLQADSATEEAMIELVNKERIKRGLNALTSDTKLKDVARQHSTDMLRRGYFSHYSPEGLTVADRALNAGVDFLVVGENLAYAPNLELAHKGLMNSPGHRANLLSKEYGKIGIGVMDGGVYGKMFTQVFSN